VDKKYKLTIAYDGTCYRGWQAQPHRASIQKEVERALSSLLQHTTSIHASGRTDAGVHALGQVAHFKTHLSLETNSFQQQCNAALPNDIRILEILSVPLDFHARYSCRAKEYHYHLHLEATISPLKRFYSYHCPFFIDLDLLQQGIESFIGEKNFISFANKGKKNRSKDGIRTLYSINLCQEEGGIRLQFKGNGFLYRMIRNIVGTLIAVARGKIKRERIEEFFKEKRRDPLLKAAPPQGLFLMAVYYPIEEVSCTATPSKEEQ